METFSAYFPPPPPHYVVVEKGLLHILTGVGYRMTRSGLIVPNNLVHHIQFPEICTKTV